VLLADIVRRIQIGIQAIATLFAQKEGLRLTIGAMLMSTARASLGSMSRVDSFDPDTPFLRLIDQERLKLSKRPTMQSALCFAFLSDLARTADMFEILNHDGRAGEAVGNDALGEDVITVPVEASRLATQFLEMATSRPGSFGLQGTTEAETTTIDFFPMSVPQELASRGDGRMVESQVYPNHVRDRGNSRFRNRDHHIQPVLPFATTQICCGDPVALVSGTEWGNREGNTHLPGAGREPNRRGLPVECIGFLVVANRTEPRTGLADFPTFAFAINGRFEGFRSFDASLDQQIADQPRAGLFGRVIRAVVQPNSVLFLALPSIRAYRIKGRSELLKRFTKCFCLLWSGMQLYPYRSVHTQILPYMHCFCKKGGTALPPPVETWRYPRRRNHGVILDRELTFQGGEKQIYRLPYRTIHTVTLQRAGGQSESLKSVKGEIHLRRFGNEYQTHQLRNISQILIGIANRQK
jgi:hypothetical protein